MPKQIFKECKCLYDRACLDSKEGARVGGVQLMLTKFGHLDIYIENFRGDYFTDNIALEDLVKEFDNETVTYLTSVFHAELVKRLEEK